MSQLRLSLLSLSIAAANAAPMAPASPVAESAARPSQGATTNTATKHRRLSSAGRSRRRLSDARDAATRPFPTSLQTASASLAALSLSSPTVPHRPVNGAQPIQISQATSVRGTSELPGSVEDTDTPLSASPPQSHTPLASNPVNGTKSGRKRGTIFTCESCSKVYRHPSCLIKHRWEHTPQWREASKFVLSKHQQVQLLEAAAILSHLSPSSASLPEDRSLWPSFLSGGLVPLPTSVPNSDLRPTPIATASPPTSASSIPISSSVPASTMMGSHCAPSTSPRLHDHAISRSGIGIAQVRPGMLGVPTGTNQTSVPMPMEPAQTTEDALNLLALCSGSGTGSWGGPTSVSVSVPLSHSRAHSHSHSHSSPSHALRERERRRSNAYEYGFAPGSESGSGYDYASSLGYAHPPNPNGGWSLPRSSVRSKSGSPRSRSQSASESRSDDEHEDEGEGVFGGVDVRVGLEDEMEDGVDQAKVYESRMREDMEDGKDVRRVEQAWDGMEMEMEMD